MRPSREIRIGTRGSALALAQAEEVRRRLQARFPSRRFRIVTIKTRGDEFQAVELFKKKGIGVFTKAIEKKLLDNKIDIAVHSLKDLPTQLPKGLLLAAVPKRLDTRDLLVSRKRYTLASLPKGSVVGTGSPRRKRQIFGLRPDLVLEDIRGNLDTRVRKVLKRELDALVVARAGLLRLKKYLRFAVPVPRGQILPAVGQGALGLETRKGDRELLKMARLLNHSVTEKEVSAERLFLKALRGGCRVPVGIDAAVRNGKIFLKAAVFSTQTTDRVCGEASGPVDRYPIVSRSLAKKLLKNGAARFLREARK